MNQHLRVHRSPGQSDASFSAQLELYFSNGNSQNSALASPQDQQPQYHSQEEGSIQAPHVHLPAIFSGPSGSTTRHHHDPLQDHQTLHPLYHEHADLNHHHEESQQQHHQATHEPHYRQQHQHQPEQSENLAEVGVRGPFAALDDDRDYDENGAPLPPGARASSVELSQAESDEDEGSVYAPSR